MQIGDSYFMEDLRGTRVLILKDPLDESFVAAMARQGTTRVVVRGHKPWQPVELGAVAKQVRELWIEDADASVELAGGFPYVVSLHLVRPPRDGFLSSFAKLEECRLDRLAELPAELPSLAHLKSLTLGDACRFGGKADFAALGGLEKLVLSGASLPKGFSAFEGLGNLRFLGMSQWKGPDLKFMERLTGLRECVLTHFSKVTSVAGIEAAESLGRLHLSTFPQLANVEALMRLEKLKVLILEDCPALASLAPLAGHPSLEELSLWGRTDVKDGRLQAVKDSPRLRTFQFNKRRHYDLKVSV